MDLVSNWMHVEIFTVDQAAALWCGFEPTKLSYSERLNPPKFLAAKQMIISAILSGEITEDSRNNYMNQIGDYSRTYVTRSDLEVFARKRKIYPNFLFNTLTPELDTSKPPVAIQSIAEKPEKTQTQNNKGGRPQEYDWDSFTMEIIHLANQPDGLPDTQAELVRKMLAWFVEQFGSEPAESSVKSKISKIYKYLEEAKNHRA